MEQGSVADMIIQQAIRAKQPIPEKILNAPELRQGLDLYYMAFWDLDTERSHGMGLMRIPWSAIYNYAKILDFDEEQTEALLYFIPKMDQEHLKRLEKKQGK